MATGTYPTKLTVLATKTGTRGPWLKSLPIATVSKNGYVIAAYTPTAGTYAGYTAATGTFTVKTKGTATARTATTKTVCKGA